MKANTKTNKNLNQDLLDRQSEILFRATAIASIGMFLVGLLLFIILGGTIISYSLFTYSVLLVIGGYVYRFHRKILYYYYHIMGSSVITIILISLNSGGVYSRFLPIIVTTAFTGYIYSRKQGRIWVSISIAAAIGIYILTVSGLIFENCVEPISDPHFSIICITFTLIIFGVGFGELMAKTSSRAYKQKKLLEEKNQLILTKNKEIKKLSTLANQSNSIMLLVDLDGEISWANSALKETFGFGIDDIYEKYNSRSIFKLSDNKRIENYLQEVRETLKPVTYETKNKTASKEIIWMKSTISPLFDNENELIQYSIVDTDITQNKLNEEEIREQNEELNQINEELEAQRDQIEDQNKTLEYNNSQITASINYAKRIQTALLKSEKHESKHLPPHFILFKPKDLVSGDFYWALEKQGHLYIAVADCTGHGVPGAFLTMLGTSFLNEINSTPKLLSPAKVLGLLRDKFVKELSQKGNYNEPMDGMDISLLLLDYKSLELHGFSL